MKMPIACAIAAAIALGAPITAQAVTKNSEARSCFNTRNISGWSPASGDAVNLRVGVSDFYQLNLAGGCPDVDWNQAIALQSHGSDWICSGLDVDVIVPRTTIGPQRCMATGLHKLTPSEVAALPKRQKP